MEIDIALDELEAWAKTFLATVQDGSKQIKEAFDSDKLPQNCPSHASLAELIFRDVKKRLADVQLCMERVEEAIWREGKH